MNELSFQDLDSYDGTYLSVGITEGAKPRTCILVPWDRTVNAMNMKLPQLYLSSDQIRDPEVLEKLKKYKVWGVYIFVPLEDYSFLEQFPHLRDVNIKHAEKLNSLEFLRGKDWNMLYLERANLTDLEPAFEMLKQPEPEHTFEMRRYPNLALYHCKINQIDALLQEDVTLSELIVWNRSKADRNRWKKVKTYTFRHYAIGGEEETQEENRSEEQSKE